MPGKMMPQGWVPNLPITEPRRFLYPRTLKPQPEHTLEELAKAKRYPREATSQPDLKTGYRLAMDYVSATKLSQELKSIKGLTL